MNPLIKWAGGKSGEIKYMTPIIPHTYDRYIEPFFGGGALFFYLEPKKAVINDITKELVMFYSFLKDGKGRDDFKKELDAYVKYWYRIDEYMKHFGDSFLVLYNKYKNNKLTDGEFEEENKNLFANKIVPFNGLFAESFCISQKSLMSHTEKNVVAKLKRIKYTIDTKNKFTNEMLMTNIETAFRSGFYIHFRDIGNKAKRGELKISDAKKTANYYFVREFCYGSMFRFNKNGDFNIPYGGIGYNQKDFKKKVDVLFSENVKKLFENTIVENIDFEAVLNKHKPTSKDFIFFDPPYDTEFSEYEENPFTKQDQERLAKCIYNLKANFILIIKETPFILNLYKNDKFQKKGIKISSFGKTYLYNMRGRNERDVRHLMIHNLKDQKTLV